MRRRTYIELTPRTFGLAAVLGLTVAAIVWSPTAEAKTSKCRVINKAADATFGSLQSAVNQAQANATLFVRGTCYFLASIDKNLTITGEQPSGFTAPTLNGAFNTGVLWIGEAATVTVNSIMMTGGYGGVGGAIVNHGTLTLNGSTVANSFSSIIGVGDTSSGFGGGILNHGAVTLNASVVTNNGASLRGGGIYNTGSVTIAEDSSISANTASFVGGGGIYNTATGSVTLTGSGTVSGNFAGAGGGIWNESGGTLVGAVAGPGGNVFGNIPNDIYLAP